MAEEASTSSKPGRGAGLGSLALILLVVLGLNQWLGSRAARGEGQVLRELARPGDILMLSSTTCAICKNASAWLKAQQVPHRECLIEDDAACAAEYRARGAIGTPTFVVRGQTVLGFDRRRIGEILREPVKEAS